MMHEVFKRILKLSIKIPWKKLLKQHLSIFCHFLVEELQQLNQPLFVQEDHNCGRQTQII